MHTDSRDDPDAPTLLCLCAHTRAHLPSCAGKAGRRVLLWLGPSLWRSINGRFISAAHLLRVSLAPKNGRHN